MSVIIKITKKKFLFTLLSWFLFTSQIITGNPINVDDLIKKVPMFVSSSSLNKLIVFSFDGFRHDYVNEIDTPNLHALANAGVRGLFLFFG